MSNDIVRRLSALAVLVWLALGAIGTGTLAAQANNLLAAQASPSITEVRGVADGAALTGRVVIEAIVAPNSVRRVVFSLEGPTPMTHTERVAPYYFLGDDNGAARGWDTAKAANGSYTLRVRAVDRSGQSAERIVRFRVANGVVATPTTVATAPTATLAPSTPPPHDHGGWMVGVCGEPMDSWHPPTVTGPDGRPCATGHEHGDAPPAWIAQAGYQVLFHGHFNTSAAENSAKHAAMKGMTARFNNVDIYFRIHAASNPLDRMARYHSYEVWARDPSGNVSHWQLWYNSGDPRPAAEGGSRVLRRNPPLAAEAQRPIILAVDETSLQQGLGCEQWYSAPGEPSWGWDFGWTICGATTLYRPGENATAGDPATWVRNPSGTLGLTRRLEAAWYSFREHPTGAFYSTQFGEIVSGPADPRCSATTVRFGQSYQNVCLQQYIAPTLPTVAFPGNAVQKDFEGAGVQLPN